MKSVKMDKEFEELYEKMRIGAKGRIHLTKSFMEKFKLEKNDEMLFISYRPNNDGTFTFIVKFLRERELCRPI